MTDTTYSMTFDFTSADQRENLQYLQKNQYVLLGYKGATGPNLLTVGMPTWFTIPFGNLFGQVTIDYTPQYKVYVFNSATIAANTIIQMQALSNPIGLGNALQFLPDGSFASAGTTDNGSIKLTNNRPSTTPVVTVGLAGLVNLPAGPQYLPFCAFKLPPQGSVNMSPVENVALFAAQVNLQSGNVQASAAAPGSSFAFSSATTLYNLMIQDGSYAVTNVPNTALVNYVPSGTALIPLLNS